MKLRRRLYIAFAVAAVLPTLVVAALLVLSFVRAADDAEEKQAQTLVEVAARAIDMLTQSAERDLRAIASTAVLLDRPGEASRRLAEASYAYPYLLDLLWVSPQGVVLAASDAASVGQPLGALYEELVDDLPAVLRDRAGELHVSDFDDVAPSMRATIDAGRIRPRQPTLQMLLSVNDLRGHAAGVLIAALSPAAFGVALAELKGSAPAARSAQLVSREGRLLASTDPGAALLLPHALADRIAGELRAAAGATVQWHHESGWQRQHVTLRETSGLGRKRAAVWGVVLTQSQGRVGGAVLDTLVWTLGVLAAMLAAVWWAGLRIARSIVDPAEALAATARRLGAGERSARAAATADDEHGELARAFNTMADALERVHDELELRVQERTAELARAAAVLQDREARLGLLLTSSPAVIWSSRAEGDYARSFVGDNVRAQLGHDAADFLGDPKFWLAHVHPDDVPALLAGLPAQIEQGRIEHEYRFRHGDGTWRWIHAEATVLRDANGRPESIVGYWIDVSERRRAREAIESASRMKSEFMASVTHELRTPLNSVIGFAELLHDEVPGPLNARQAEFVADILAGGRQLLELVDAILEMSRLEADAALAREPVDIAAALAERVAAQRPAAEARGLTMTQEVAPDAGSAQLDPRALRRMLDALLDNAIKFNREGGTVAVRARRDGGWLEITVADSGIGIAGADLAKLFQPLVQLDSGLARAHGGIGLGLALARCLAELHGGTIEVESEPGTGSTFTLRLPLQEKS